MFYENLIVSNFATQKLLSYTMIPFDEIIGDVTEGHIEFVKVLITNYVN